MNYQTINRQKVQLRCFFIVFSVHVPTMIYYIKVLQVKKMQEFCLYFVKIIHRKKALRKVAFWSEKSHALTACRNHRFEIDIESKWVYSQIKLSFIISCILF